jgi:hypothetical protein
VNAKLKGWLQAGDQFLGHESLILVRVGDESVELLVFVNFCLSDQPEQEIVCVKPNLKTNYDLISGDGLI